MEILQAIILGIIQGLSEFLPISSSGHLVVAPWIFDWEDNGLAFDVALHFGTLAAVLSYFWSDWKKILQLAFQKNYELRIINYASISKHSIFKKFNLFKNLKLKIKNSEQNFNNTQNIHYNSNILWLIIAATIPGVLAGFFLEEMAETVFRNPLLIAFNLFFWGLILFLADKYFKHKKDISEITFLDGILVGLAQALAIVPGTSRSGITITAALWRGLDRVSAARFSFLMLTPIVFGASALKVGDLLANFNLSIALGIIASAVSGYLAIKYLIKFVEKTSYRIFFWYRLALALVIIFWLV